VLARCDGLVLSGGADFDPALYGESARPEVARLHVRRERFDLALCRTALERRLPTLGICGGMQALAVAAGGRLCQDIPALVPGAARHAPEPGGSGDVHHAIALAPGSRLAAVLGGTAITVNSHHHQAVVEPGRGFTVVAHCPTDGVAEAMEGPGFCLGVQWHPERLAAPAGARPLFAALVAEAARRVAGGAASTGTR
jgi:putative glutamine amidotransferase